MSRTDKTAPGRVKAMAKPGSTCVESHNHEKGHCDLPELNVDEIGWAGVKVEGGWSCHWTYGKGFLYGSGSGCGCPRCSDQDGRKIKARRTRYAGRREARQPVDADGESLEAQPDEYEAFDGRAEGLPAGTVWHTESDPQPLTNL